MKRIKLGGMTLAALGAAWFLLPVMNAARHLCPLRPTVREAAAMPQWARRYGVNCSMCHTTVPRLTKVGYQFRANGFRMPDELGKEAKLAGINDLYAARIREEFKVTGAATDGTAANAKVAPTDKFAFHELTFYPVTGAFGKWWGAESELTFNPGEFTEVENAYVRAAVPYRDFVFTARAGIFHPFEGYGASDRAISNIRPLFQTNSAKDKDSGFDPQVKIWGQDQEGLELGASWKDSRLTMSILNGFNTTTGEANEGDDNNLRDFLFFFNQAIGDSAGVSAEYLNGKTGFSYAGGAGKDWINNYQKFALYGNVMPLPKLNLLAGYELGKNHLMNAATHDGSQAYADTGWFLEAESALHEHFTGGLRLDTYDPSTHSGHDRLSAVTFTGVLPFENIKFLADYQIKRTQKLAGKDRTDNTLRLEWMYIF